MLVQNARTEAVLGDPRRDVDELEASFPAICVWEAKDSQVQKDGMSNDKPRWPGLEPRGGKESFSRVDQVNQRGLWIISYLHAGLLTSRKLRWMFLF